MSRSPRLHDALEHIQKLVMGPGMVVPEAWRARGEEAAAILASLEHEEPTPLLVFAEDSLSNYVAQVALVTTATEERCALLRSLIDGCETRRGFGTTIVALASELARIANDSESAAAVARTEAQIPSLGELGVTAFIQMERIRIGRRARVDRDGAIRKLEALLEELRGWPSLAAYARADVLHDLGQILYEQAMVPNVKDGAALLERALKLTREAHKIIGELFGPQFYQLARYENALGVIMRAQRRTDESLQHYRNAAELLLRARGVTHSHLKLVQLNFADACRHAGRYKAARVAYARVLDFAATKNLSDLTFQVHARYFRFLCRRSMREISEAKEEFLALLRWVEDEAPRMAPDLGMLIVRSQGRIRASMRDRVLMKLSEIYKVLPPLLNPRPVELEFKAQVEQAAARLGR